MFLTRLNRLPRCHVAFLLWVGVGGRLFGHEEVLRQLITPKAADGSVETKVTTTEIGEKEPAIRLWTVTFIDSESNAPINGIAVVVNGAQVGQDEPRRMTLTSDESGKIDIPLRPGTATLVHVTGTGWWTDGWPLVGDADWDKDGKNDTPDWPKPRTISLRKGTVAMGRLLKPDGQPAAGVVLKAGVYINNGTWMKRLGRQTVLNTWDHGQWPNWTHSATTAEDGSFSVTVPPSDARSWVRVGTGNLDFTAIDVSAGALKNKNHALVCYAPFEVEVNGGNGTRLIDESDGVIELGEMHLQNGVVLRGQVLDSDGSPLEGVHLTTSNRHGPHGGRKAVSKPDGSFEFLPMTPGTIQLSPDARLRNDRGDVNSRDVQAVFTSQEVSIPESSDVVDLTVQAVKHVMLEFEWVDRRAQKGPVSYYGEFKITGRIPIRQDDSVWWHGATEKIRREGKEYLSVKVPAEIIEPTLRLPADQSVTASYSDGEVTSGPGKIRLGDITKPMKRVIYGDEPRR